MRPDLEPTTSSLDETSNPRFFTTHEQTSSLAKERIVNSELSLSIQLLRTCASLSSTDGGAYELCKHYNEIKVDGKEVKVAHGE
jgi:hypothetical protein